MQQDINRKQKLLNVQIHNQGSGPRDDPDLINFNELIL